MNAYFTSQFQILEIRGIYSPEGYWSSDQDPADRLLAPDLHFEVAHDADSKPRVL